MNNIKEESIDFEDTLEDDNHFQTEIPKEERKLITQAYDKAIIDLMRMIDEEDLILNPEYQREYVWNDRKASLLIESILLNVPIPVIYVSQEEDDTWIVIDGLQRLNSLHRFFKGNFKLKNMEVLQELNGQDIDSLKKEYSKAYKILKNGLIRVIMISSESHPEIKYDIFMRLNVGAVKLNQQELRNALYRSYFNEKVKELRDNKQFMEMLNLKEPDNRMKDAELVIRFLALHEAWDYPKKQFKTKIDDKSQKELSAYPGNFKTFLNEFMNAQKDIKEDKVLIYNDLFENTVSKVYDTLGQDAFKRLDKEGKPERINKALIDCLMLSFAHNEKEKLLSKAEEIKNILVKLINEDVNFRDSITVATSDRKAIQYRLSTWSNELNSVINESA